MVITLKSKVFFKKTKTFELHHYITPLLKDASTTYCLFYLCRGCVSTILNS